MTPPLDAPGGPTLPPGQVADLEARVQFRLGCQVRHLRLLLHERGLILHGRARSYYAKQLAQHAVLELTDIPILANEIEVT
jgi:hypothetical protein